MLKSLFKLICCRVAGGREQGRVKSKVTKSEKFVRQLRPSPATKWILEETPPSGRLSLFFLVWIHPSGHHTDINCIALLTQKDKRVSWSTPMGASETNRPPGQWLWEWPGARPVATGAGCSALPGQGQEDLMSLHPDCWYTYAYIHAAESGMNSGFFCVCSIYRSMTKNFTNMVQNPPLMRC